MLNYNDYGITVVHDVDKIIKELKGNPATDEDVCEAAKIQTKIPCFDKILIKFPSNELERLLTDKDSIYVQMGLSIM